MARLLIVAGVVFVVGGLLLLFFPRALAWFGHLPGDIDIKRGNTRIMIPLTSMLVASVVLSLLLNAAGWFMRQIR